MGCSGHAVSTHQSEGNRIHTRGSGLLFQQVLYLAPRITVRRPSQHRRSINADCLRSACFGPTKWPGIGAGAGCLCRLPLLLVSGHRNRATAFDARVPDGRERLDTGRTDRTSGRRHCCAIPRGSPGTVGGRASRIPSLVRSLRGIRLDEPRPRNHFDPHGECGTTHTRCLANA